VLGTFGIIMQNMPILLSWVPFAPVSQVLKLTTVTPTNADKLLTVAGKKHIKSLTIFHFHKKTKY